MRFPSRARTFIRDLQRHNDRAWFAEHKPRYEAARAEVEAFAKTVHDALAVHDALDPSKAPLTRIYRDTRFSKDKRPYKCHWGGGLDRLGRERRGGYYWHVEPGGLHTWPEFDSGAEAFVGGGFWAPEPADLARIRAELAADPAAFRALLAAPPVSDVFDGLYPANLLKTAPRDYPKDHPAIDLLRHKSFVLVRHFSREEVARDDFSEEVTRTLLAMRPFLDAMTEILNTDANGEPLP